MEVNVIKASKLSLSAANIILEQKELVPRRVYGHIRPLDAEGFYHGA